MKVGEADDGEIETMIDMKYAMYSVHEHAIYAMRLADQIDPERANAAVPSTQQKVLSLGAQDSEVGRIPRTCAATAGQGSRDA